MYVDLADMNMIRPLVIRITGLHRELHLRSSGRLGMPDLRSRKRRIYRRVKDRPVLSRHKRYGRRAEDIPALLPFAKTIH